MDILDKLQALNDEIDNYIANVDKSVTDLTRDADDIWEEKYKRMRDFLKERSEIAMKMGLTTMDIETGVEFEESNYHLFVVARLGSGGTLSVYPIAENKNINFTQTTVKCTFDRVSHKDFMKEILRNWDAITENIFDQNFYKACTEQLQKKVKDANDRLDQAKARVEDAGR